MPVVVVLDEPVVVCAAVVVCRVGAAGRTAGPSDGGCKRADLNIYATKVLVLTYSAVIAAIGEAEYI